MKQVYRLSNEGMQKFVEMAYSMPMLSREKTNKLILEYQKTGNPAAKNQIINSNIRYVLNYVANVYQISADVLNSRVLEDIVQDGIKGMMEAIDKFDTTKNVAFQTYAAKWIQKYVSLSFEENMGKKRVSKHYQRLGKKMEEIERKWMQENEEPISDWELQTQMGIPIEKIKIIQRVQETCFCELTPAIMDSLEDYGCHVEREAIKNVGLDSIYLELKELLLDKEFEVITYMMGYEDETIHTMAETGDYFGVTKQAISRILNKVRTILAENGMLEHMYNETEIKISKKAEKFLNKELKEEERLLDEIRSTYVPVSENLEELRQRRQKMLEETNIGAEVELAADEAYMNSLKLNSTVSNIEAFAKDFFKNK